MTIYFFYSVTEGGSQDDKVSSKSAEIAFMSLDPAMPKFPGT